MRSQSRRRSLSYAMPGYATTARAELSKLLLEVLPKGLNKFFFTTSVQRRTRPRSRSRACTPGKTKIIARYRSYHGSTAGSIAATGDPRRWAMEPRGKGPGIHLWAGGPLLQVSDQAYVSGLRHCVRGLHRAHDPQRIGCCRCAGRADRWDERRHRSA